MEHLKNIKSNLIRVIENELGHLETVDTKELGEAIDMVKDIAEAMYYCKITEAMEEKEHTRHYVDYKYREPYDVEWENDRMYYNTMSTPYTGFSGSKNYTWMMPDRDHREGRSPMSRKTYMEAKEMKQPKTTQMQELEHYMQELSTDITEMIRDASPEEKSMLEKKLNGLAQKVAEI